MLNEILRQSYEQGREINIVLPKNATESYVVSAIALRNAMKLMSQETDVTIIADKDFEGVNSIYNALQKEEQEDTDRIYVFLGGKEDTEFSTDIKKIARRENIYAFNCNARDQKARSVAKKYNIPEQNVLLDQEGTSLCQTIAMQLKRANGLDEETATLLIYGILKETDNLRNGSQKSFEIVSMLMQNGGDYKKAFGMVNKLFTIEQRKVIADVLSNVDIHDIEVDEDKKRIAFLHLNKDAIKKLRAAGITDLSSIVKKLQDISDIEMSFAIVEDESNEKKYDIYFMRTDLEKGVDLESLSSKFGEIKSSKFFAKSKYAARGVFKGPSQIVKRVLEEIEDEYKRESGKVDVSCPKEITTRFVEILKRTNNFSENVSATDLREAAKLIGEGANQSLLYMNVIPLNIFLLREDLALKISDEEAKNNRLFIDVSKNDASVLEARFGVEENDILECANLFTDTDASEIRLEIDSENGKKVRSKVSKQAEKAKKLINSVITAGRRTTKEEINKQKHLILDLLKSREESKVRGG